MKSGIIIVIFGFLVLFSWGVVAQEVFCIEDPSEPGGQKCYSDVGPDVLPELVQNYDNFLEFREDRPTIAQDLIENYPDKVVEGVMGASVEDQVRYFLELDSNNEYFLSDDVRSDVVNGLPLKQKNELMGRIINTRMKALYPDSEVPNVEVLIGEGEKVIFEGSKIKVPGGGSIQLGRKDVEAGDKDLDGNQVKQHRDQIDLKLRKVEFVDGDIKLTYEDNTVVRYNQGSVAGTQFVNPEGGIVGGNKELGFSQGEENKNREISVRYIEGEDGKTYAEFSISGDEGAIGLRAIDIEGNEYHINANTDEKDSSGNLYPPLVRVGEDGVLQVKSVKIDRENFADLTIDHDEFVALIGNTFNLPGVGVYGVQERFGQLMGLPLAEEILEEAKNTFDEAKPEDLVESSKEFQEVAVERIKDALGAGESDVADVIFDQMFPRISAITKLAGLDPVGNAAELAGRIQEDLQIVREEGVFGGGAAFLDGEGNLLGPAFEKALVRTVNELGTKEYEKYTDPESAYSGQAFYYEEVRKDEMPG